VLVQASGASIILLQTLLLPSFTSKMRFVCSPLGLFSLAFFGLPEGKSHCSEVLLAAIDPMKCIERVNEV
jgi:hypothetical protein